MDLCVRNETSASLECAGAQTDALHSGGNGSLEASSLDSNVSASLVPQRMRDKGEWTHTGAVNICPKWHFSVEYQKKGKPSPQARRKERLMSLDAIWSSMAAWEASVMH